MLNNIRNVTAKSLSVLFAMSALSLPAIQTAQAGMIATQEIAQEAQLQADREGLQQLIARSDVSDYLMAKGVNPADVQNRINNLTDAEVIAFKRQLDELPAGGEFLGAVIGILVIFILLDIAGVTDIFPRI